jgi:hypothetical protein
MQYQIGPFNAVQSFIFPTTANKIVKKNQTQAFGKIKLLIILCDVFQKLLEQQLEEAVLEARHF